MDIPLFKVAMRHDVPSRAGETLMSGYVGQGKRVEEFEAELASYLRLPYAPLTTNSCTSALDLAMHLLGVGPGREVITTPITCTATNSPAVTRGATLVWADVDPLTGLIDPADVARKITSRTACIMAVDWGGRPCDYRALRALGVPVVQDAAHLPLPGCQRGDYTCWSFQAIKHLTTVDGGALLTPPDQMERARLLRWYGLDRRSSADFRCAQDIEEAGYKYHMNDVAATIGLCNLALLPAHLQRHSANAYYYLGELRDLPGVTLPATHGAHSWWLFTLLVEDRDAFIAALAERGIAASPVHARNDVHTAFRRASQPAYLPGVDHFAAHEVAIPVGWWVGPDQRAEVADAVRDWAIRRVEVAR